MRDFFLQKITLVQLVRYARNIVLVLVVLAIFLSTLFWRMWQVRGRVADIGWEYSIVATEPGDMVTATWLGTTTLLFDDGETQILIDGAFTRVGPLQTILLRREAELQQMLTEVMPTDFAGFPADQAGVGTGVRIAFPGGRHETYFILGEWDRDEELGISSSTTRMSLKTLKSLPPSWY